MPSTDIDQQINAVLAAYLHDPSLIGPILEDSEELPLFARKFNALPIYADIGGAFLLRPSGEVLFISSNQVWDSTAEAEVLRSRKWLKVAYNSCAQRFPSLSEVINRLALASNKSFERTREG